MTSRAILRRKRLIPDYLNASTHLIRSIQSFGYPFQNCDSRHYVSSAKHTSLDCNHVNEAENSKAQAEISGFSGFGHFVNKYHGTTVLGFRNEGSEHISLTGFWLVSQSVRSASTATAKQPEVSSDDEENEDLVAKKRKEASPEDCDQAVEGLSNAKAKAKAKRLQESQKVAESILQKTWSALLGIGPALRAVASMSRLN